MLNKSNTDPKSRFTNRVSDYSLYRPSYPSESINYIIDQLNLDSRPGIADIGSGTGLFTELLLEKNASVTAVEPNDAMRMESDGRLSHYDTYSSVKGSAEQTGLGDHSVDVITAAQAFHWFDLPKAKQEFSRILKPGGHIVLIWNRRDNASSEFLRQYESVLTSLVPEYNKVNHALASDEVIGEFLGSSLVCTNFNNHQDFDLDGFKGRVLSSSYSPAEGQDGHNELMTAIEQLYDTHATDSGVRFEYITQVYSASY